MVNKEIRNQLIWCKNVYLKMLWQIGTYGITDEAQNSVKQVQWWKIEASLKSLKCVGVNQHFPEVFVF